MAKAVGMKKKIEWYQEVLSLEPGSRVFFPLAQLFVELGEPQNAVDVLQRGLDRHPDHLEARLMLAQVQSDLGHADEALVQVERVVEPLKKYRAFWRLWAQAQPEENRDFSVFLMLVATALGGKTIRWSDIVMEGVTTLSDRLVGPLPESRKPEPVEEDPVSFTSSGVSRVRPSAGGLRTRTMADLLAAQGDYQSALDIYRELWNNSADPADRQDLSRRIEEVESGMGGEDARLSESEREDAFSKHAKNRLIGALEALASRFEARVRTETD